MKPGLNGLVDMLASYGGVQKVYLLGEQNQLISSQHIFSGQHTEEAIGNNFLLLILVEEWVNLKNLESHLESKFDSQRNKVVSLIMKESIFSKEKRNNDFFAMSVSAKAKLLYCSASKHEMIVLPENLKEVPTTDVNTWLNRSCEFLVGAQLYLLRKQIKMAAFCLHQAAEQAYSAILFRYMGFRPETHQLLKLHRYAQFFHPRLFTLFPPCIPKEECLLHYLQTAYIEARYSEKFHASTEKISMICEKVSMLIKYASAEKTIAAFQFQHSEEHSVVLEPAPIYLLTA